MTRLVTAIAALALVTPAGAQSSRPATWKVILDRPVSTDWAIDYSTMRPGWHVTTMQGALLFDPAWQVPDSGVVLAEIFLFPDSGPAEYGVFLAGSDMDGAGRRYTAVLLRRDGAVAVFRRNGAAMDTLVPWIRNRSIAALDSTSTEPVKNVLRIETGVIGTSISVNGSRVAAIPGGALLGQAGLRVGDKMNLHVSKLEVMRER